LLTRYSLQGVSSECRASGNWLIQWRPSATQSLPEAGVLRSFELGGPTSSKFPRPPGSGVLTPCGTVSAVGSTRAQPVTDRSSPHGEVYLSTGIKIRPFAENDASQVRELFITVNRLLSPPDLHDAFEAYIERALAEEIDRITAYYGERDGGFWVAIRDDNKLVGTFGLERASHDAMELRRMYVDPDARRRGIARQMLRFAEDECRKRKIVRLERSTSELQSAALALYRNAGYQLNRENFSEIASNKTVGFGLRRFYFGKDL
jgi:GNAT superfamily N-acetyltransferase